MDEVTPSWIQIARLLRPQGRRGELLAEPLTDQLALFFRGRSFSVSDASSFPGSLPPLILEDCWEPQGKNAGRIVLKLAGVDSISDAERMEGHVLWLEQKDLPALEAGTFFVRDLVGCTLLNGEDAVGTIQDLQFAVGADGRTRLPDAPDLLAVHLAGTPEEADPVLVPFVKAWLQSVDIEGKRIVMNLPDGLLG